MIERETYLDMGDPCREAFRHGPADGAGRCPWCREKFEFPAARPREFGVPWHERDAIAAYRRTYDPDWGAEHTDSDPTR